MQAREFRRRRHHRSMPELRSCSIVCYVIGLAKITLPRKAGRTAQRACAITRHAAVGPRMALYRAVESRPVMVAGIMTRECVGHKIIRAVAAAAVRDAAAGRRTRALQHGPVGRIPGRRRWPASIQNVQIGIIKRERAGLPDGGLRECRRRCGRGQQHGRCNSFE